jgi:hypothetical protein
MSYVAKRTTRQAVLSWAACAVAALSAVVAPPASAQLQKQQRVAIDPETGQIRAPELDELPSANARAAAPGARAAAPAQERARPVAGVKFGAKGFRMDANRMPFTVVNRNPDGSISTQCVTGEAAVAKALQGAQVGGAHDH